MGLDSREHLAEGASILQPLLSRYGFSFQIDEGSPDSDSSKTVGRFVRDDRSIELHCRRGLGVVKYRRGEFSLGHSTYMRRLGVRDRAEYPVVADGSLRGFEALRHDLKEFCSDFISGPAEEFTTLCGDRGESARSASGRSGPVR